MRRFHVLSLSFFLLSVSLLVGQDEGKLKSGPKTGEFIPGPFESFNVNGPMKGRPHCFVCKFALDPSVLIFTKEPAEGKDDAFNEFLKQLDEVATEFEHRNFSAGVVVLSPDARDSTNNIKEADLEKLNELAKKDPDELAKLMSARAKLLIDEAVAREKLYERLKKRAEPYKNVVMGYFLEEGPKKFNINPKAEVTIVFYERLKVSDSWAFGPGEFQGKDVEAIVKKVRESLPLKKKKA